MSKAIEYIVLFVFVSINEFKNNHGSFDGLLNKQVYRVKKLIQHVPNLEKLFDVCEAENKSHLNLLL